MQNRSLTLPSNITHTACLSDGRIALISGRNEARIFDPIAQTYLMVYCVKSGDSLISTITALLGNRLAVGYARTENCPAHLSIWQINGNEVSIIGTIKNIEPYALMTDNRTYFGCWNAATKKIKRWNLSSYAPLNDINGDAIDLGYSDELQLKPILNGIALCGGWSLNANQGRELIIFSEPTISSDAKTSPPSPARLLLNCRIRNMEAFPNGRLLLRTEDFKLWSYFQGQLSEISLLNLPRKTSLFDDGSLLTSSDNHTFTCCGLDNDVPADRNEFLAIMQIIPDSFPLQAVCVAKHKISTWMNRASLYLTDENECVWISSVLRETEPTSAGIISDPYMMALRHLQPVLPEMPSKVLNIIKQYNDAENQFRLFHWPAYLKQKTDDKIKKKIRRSVCTIA